MLLAACITTNFDDTKKGLIFQFLYTDSKTKPSRWYPWCIQRLVSTHPGFLHVSLPPATKLGQGNVFTGVYDSVHRGDRADTLPPRTDTPRDQTPSAPETPPPSGPDTPPRTKPPRSRHTPLQSRHPPGIRHPHPGQPLLRAVRIVLECILVFRGKVKPSPDQTFICGGVCWTNLKLKVLSPDQIFIFGGGVRWVGGWIFGTKSNPKIPSSDQFFMGGGILDQPKTKVLSPNQIFIFWGGVVFWTKSNPKILSPDHVFMGKGGYSGPT